MRTRRNFNFWTAAIVVAASYLILTAKYVIEAFHRLDVPGVSSGLDAAILINIGAQIVGAVGWVIVASAFALVIDWRRLRLGAAIVAGTYVATYAAWGLEVVELPDRSGNLYGYLLWASIGAFLLAIGALVVVSGLGDSKRGAPRGSRLQIGLAIAAASAAAVAVAAFDLHAFHLSSSGFSLESRIGTLVVAIAQIGVALAIIFAALDARSPLPRRERTFMRAAAGGSLATFCVAAGWTFVAVGFSTRDPAQWVAYVAWLVAANAFVFALGIAFVALGARSAARGALGEGLGAAEQ